MANNGLTKSYFAEAAILPNRFVKPGTADLNMLTAAAATDKIMGVTTEIDAAIGERVDVGHFGIFDLKLGGAVARGDPLTSDAAGAGVVAVATNRIGAFANISGVAGDIIPVTLALGVM